MNIVPVEIPKYDVLPQEFSIILGYAILARVPRSVESASLKAGTDLAMVLIEACADG
jgi:hypothetical protein